MTDDGFRELLKSPLDERPERDPARRRPQFVGLGAAVVGAVLTAAIVWSLGGFDAATPPATTAAVVALPPSTVPPPSAADGTLELQWLLEGDGAIYAAVADIAPAPRDGGPGIVGANWSLRLADGSTVAADAEFLDDDIPGVFVAAFPAEGVSIGDVTAIVARPLSGTSEAVATTEVMGTSFPLALPPPADLRVGGTMLVVDSAVLHGAGGEVEWRLDGTSDERATLVVAADYRRPGAERDQAIRTEFEIPGVPLQLGQDADEPARAGSIDLFHLDDPEEPTFRTRFWGDPDEEFAVEAVTVTWTLTVHRYDSDPIMVPAPPGR